MYHLGNYDNSLSQQQKQVLGVLLPMVVICGLRRNLWIFCKVFCRYGHIYAIPMTLQSFHLTITSFGLPIWTNYDVQCDKWKFTIFSHSLTLSLFAPLDFPILFGIFFRQCQFHLWRVFQVVFRLKDGECGHDKFLTGTWSVGKLFVSETLWSTV